MRRIIMLAIFILALGAIAGCSSISTDSTNSIQEFTLSDGESKTVGNITYRCSSTPGGSYTSSSGFYNPHLNTITYDPMTGKCRCTYKE